MAWSDVQNILQTAIATSSGYTGSKVIWRWQNASAPDFDYVDIAITSIKTIGQDYIKTTYDALRPPGQEIQEEVKGVRELALEIAVITSAVAGEAVDAMAIAEQIRTKLLLPSVRDALTAAGLSPFDPMPLQYVPTIVNTKFRGRALCTIRCYAEPQFVADLTTWIQTVTGTQTTHGTTPDPLETGWSTGSPDGLVYWGAAAIPGVYDQAFIESLGESASQASLACSITFDAATDQYLYFCAPVSYGGTNDNFINADNGIPLGMSITAVVPRVQPDSTTVDYNVWKSDTRGLGAINATLTDPA